jgi:response regulator NasT
MKKVSPHSAVDSFASAAKKNATEISAVLIDSDSTRATILQKALSYACFNLVGELKNCDELDRFISDKKPELIVIGTDTPDTKTLNALAALSKKTPLPVVMFAEQDTPNIIAKVVESGVNAYVVNDIQAQRFKAIIEVAIARFHAQRRLICELESTKNKLLDRKLIDRAKGILMQQRSLNEDQAFNTIRSMAMDKSISLRDVASNIIDVFALLKNEP